MDRLYKQNDKYKEDLSGISLKYDFDSFDRQTKCVEAFIEWCTNIIQLMGDINKQVEQQFSCGICNGMADRATVV